MARPHGKTVTARGAQEAMTRVRFLVTREFIGRGLRVNGDEENLPMGLAVDWEQRGLVKLLPSPAPADDMTGDKVEGD